MEFAKGIGRVLHSMYETLSGAYGPQHWWPGDSQEEIIIGAILTQNTNWKNVEKAIARMRAAGLINWSALRDVSPEELGECIRPAGYYNLKARRLKNFVSWLWVAHDGNLDAIATLPLQEARRQLLGVNGIGRETADAILLYALGQPSFVVDAYTGRVARRHGLIGENCGYDDLKSLFEDHLPGDVAYFGEYHALIVEVGKRHCKPRADCEGCPLEVFEHDSTAK